MPSILPSKPTLNPDKKQQELPLATMQLPVANNNLHYNLRPPWGKKGKEIRPDF